GRGLDEDGFRDPGGVLSRDHLLDAYRPLFRPIRLVPADRRTLVARLVARDHMRVRVDRRKRHGVPYARRGRLDPARTQPSRFTASFASDMSATSLKGRIFF